MNSEPTLSSAPVDPLVICPPEIRAALRDAIEYMLEHELSVLPGSVHRTRFGRLVIEQRYPANPGQPYVAGFHDWEHVLSWNEALDLELTKMRSGR